MERRIVLTGRTSYPLLAVVSTNILLVFCLVIFTFTLFFDQCRVDIIDHIECGVHDRLHIFTPLCGIFFFPWHRHQMEGTNGF